jgi:hypothetical protein
MEQEHHPVNYMDYAIAKQVTPLIFGWENASAIFLANTL